MPDKITNNSIYRIYASVNQDDLTKLALFNIGKGIREVRSALAGRKALKYQTKAEKAFEELEKTKNVAGWEKATKEYNKLKAYSSKSKHLPTDVREKLQNSESVLKHKITSGIDKLVVKNSDKFTPHFSVDRATYNRMTKHLPTDIQRELESNLAKKHYIKDFGELFNPAEKTELYHQRDKAIKNIQEKIKPQAEKAQKVYDSWMKGEKKFFEGFSNSKDKIKQTFYKAVNSETAKDFAHSFVSQLGGNFADIATNLAHKGVTKGFDFISAQTGMPLTIRRGKEFQTYGQKASGAFKAMKEHPIATLGVMGAGAGTAAVLSKSKKKEQNNSPEYLNAFANNRGMRDYYRTYSM